MGALFGFGARRIIRASGFPGPHRLVSRPFLIAQLSDLHIGAQWSGVDPEAATAAAIDGVLALADRPDAVLVSGDLTNGAANAEYEVARKLLDRLQLPTYVLPGNHDDRQGLRRHFDLPGEGAEPLQQAVDLGPLRLLMLDTTRPGVDAGELDAERLAWLERELAVASEQPTLLAMHHPPLLTGSDSWDAIGLAASARRSLAEVVGRHPQVRLLVAGHMHRAIAAELAGRVVLAIPSTYLQGKLDFTGPELTLRAEPAAFALHALVDGGLVSHIQPVI